MLNLKNTETVSSTTIKNRSKTLGRMLTRSLSIFMIVYLIVSVLIGAVYTKISSDSQTENVLTDAIFGCIEVSTASLYETLYANANAILYYPSVVGVKKSVNEYLSDQKNSLNLGGIYVISPDGKIRYSSKKEAIGRNVSDYSGTKYEGLKNMTDPEKVKKYYEECCTEEFMDDGNYYYAGDEIDEDSFVGKKGWMLAVEFEADVAGELICERGSVYCKSKSVGEDGRILLLSKEKNPDGTYKQYATRTDESYYDISNVGKDTKNISIDLEGYNGLSVFSYTDNDNIEYYAMYVSWNKLLCVALYPKTEANDSLIVTIIGLFSVLLVLTLALGILLNLMMKRGIVRPIRRMNNALETISKGNLETRVDVTDNQEFAMLSDDINIMVLTMKRYIREAEGRIDRELALARTIQHSAVPGIFPPYPDRDDFEIYASMDTAKEVGGDFYDFFFVDDDHFAIVIADVSDKGIPAAMFMMQSKTRIRARAMQGGIPAQILYDANNDLCDNNEAKLFVTVWMAIIELSTGKVTEVNAGHEHPALYRDGEYRLIRYPHSPPLAVMNGVPFANREYILRPGEKIFVYTDGVTDAVAPDGARFGEDGLVSTLNMAPNAGSEETVISVLSATKEHAGDVDQFDDITLCSFTYLGKEKREGRWRN